MDEARADMLPFSTRTSWVLAAVLLVSAPLIEWSGHPGAGLHTYTWAAIVLAPSLLAAGWLGRTASRTRLAQGVVLAACLGTSLLTAILSPDPVPGGLLRPVAAMPVWVAAALVPFPLLVAVLGLLSLVATAVTSPGSSALVAEIIAQGAAVALAVALSSGWRRGRLAVLETHLLESALDQQVIERAAVARFVRHAAHQLRTPLTPLRLLPRSLRRHIGDPEATEKAISDLERNITRFTRVVERLATLAAVEPTGHPVSGDLAGQVLRAVGDDERIRLDVPAQADVPLPDGALATVVQELLSNAQDVARERIDVLVDQVAGHWRLRIDDDGPGIPLDRRHQLREPFGRIGLEGPTGAGTGLGLALVDAVVHAGGGQMEMDDSPLGGLRVTVTLPMAGPARR